MALGVASLFASQLLGGGGGGGAPTGGGLNPLGGANLSSSDTGDVALGGFGDFNVGPAAGSGGNLGLLIAGAAALLVLVLLMRR